MRLIVSLLFCLVPSVASAALCTVFWNANLDPVTGYRVYHGLSSGQYSSTPSITTTTWGVTCEQMNILGDDRTHYFVVTAYNAGGESGHSSEVSKFLPKPVAPVRVCLKTNRNGKCLKWGTQ